MSTLEATHIGAGTRDPRLLAQQEIGAFLATTALFTAVSTAIALGEHVDVRRIEDASGLGQTVMYAQALLPTLAAIVARLAVHRSLVRPGWGVRRAPWASVARAWAFGLGTVLGGAAVVWLTGVGGFRSSALEPSLLLGLTVLVLPYLALALAEDLGWRGLLVTRLAEISSPRAVVLVGGLAWSAFHWPMIAWLGGAPEGVPLWFAVTMFTVGTTALGAVLASMQLRWGIWPGVVAHAVVNATTYHVVEPLTVEHASTTWFCSETGLVTAVVTVAAAGLWWRVAPLIRTARGTTSAPSRA